MPSMRVGGFQVDLDLDLDLFGVVAFAQQGGLAARI